MNPFKLKTHILSLISALFFASFGLAQSPSPSPTPRSTVESQEKVKIFTEEVVIPVSVYDTSGHAALESQDILVFENDERQEVRSVRRLPANVLLLLDTGGELNPVMRVSTTRDIATRLVSTLRTGDSIAAMQFGNRLELVQGWTNDKGALIRSLENKLISGRRPHLTKALWAAAAQLKEVPAGTRHLVLITDGVDLAQDPAALNGAIEELINSNITVHVIGYGAVGRKRIDKQNPLVKVTNKKRKSAQDIVDEIMNPTAIPAYKRRDRIYLIIDTDFAMRRKRSSYTEATRQGEVWLTALAEETGGLVFHPASVQQMSAPAEEIAREIDAHFVITYSPNRPLVQATMGEYRSLKVAARVPGLTLRARRGYVARSQ